MSHSPPETIDYDAAYASYLERFRHRFGDRAVGAFVKFGKHMVQKLGPQEFRQRLDTYLKLLRACRKMLESGSTISDVLVLEFQEASAWIAVEAPNLYALFRGELGDSSITPLAGPGSPISDGSGAELPDPPLGVPGSRSGQNTGG